MDYIPEIWANIARFLSTRDWARASGTSRAAFSQRTALACAQPRSCWGSRAEQETQWALHKWATCHSLFLDTGLVGGSSSSAVGKYSANVPHLRNLHIISEREVDRDTVEGFLFQCLHKRVQLLSLCAPTVKWFPAFQNLQHLVLCIGNDYPPVRNQAYEGINDHTFKAVANLTSLRTLYVESYFVRVFVSVDLTPCLRLRRVSLNKVKLSREVALPVGCKLHVEEDADELFYITKGVAPFITSLAMSGTAYKGALTPERAQRVWRFPHRLRKLADLRLTLGRNCFPDRVDQAEPAEMLQLRISAAKTPRLVLVELEVHCGVALHLEGLQRLETLVVVTKGPLQVTLGGMPELKSTLKRLFMRLGGELSNVLQAMLEELDVGTKGKTKNVLVEGEKFWEVRRPRKFRPDVPKEPCHEVVPRGCRCGACLSCLSRAGVPVVCEQAWKLTGFERLLAPICK